MDNRKIPPLFQVKDVEKIYNLAINPYYSSVSIAVFRVADNKKMLRTNISYTTLHYINKAFSEIIKSNYQNKEYPITIRKWDMTIRKFEPFWKITVCVSDKHKYNPLYLNIQHKESGVGNDFPLGLQVTTQFSNEFSHKKEEVIDYWADFFKTKIFLYLAISRHS